MTTRLERRVKIMVSCALCARCNATVLFVIAFIVIVAQVDVDVAILCTCSLWALQNQIITESLTGWEGQLLSCPGQLNQAFKIVVSWQAPLYCEKKSIDSPPVLNSAWVMVGTLRKPWRARSSVGQRAALQRDCLPKKHIWDGQNFST